MQILVSHDGITFQQKAVALGSPVSLMFYFFIIYLFILNVSPHLLKASKQTKAHNLLWKLNHIMPHTVTEGNQQ